MKYILTLCGALLFSTSASAHSILNWSDIERNRTCHFHIANTVGKDIIVLDSDTNEQVSDRNLLIQMREIDAKVSWLTRAIPAEYMGNARNFTVALSDHGGASATMYNGHRLIVVDFKWMESQSKSKLAILAHEIGHHILGHTLKDDGSRPEQELEADYFAGRVLSNFEGMMNSGSSGSFFQSRDDIRFGAFNTYLSSYQNLPNEASETHPGAVSRRAKFTKGWSIITGSGYTF